MSYPYAPTRPARTPPSFPFGWGAVTVLLVGALFTIVGIVIILYAFFGFLMGTIGAATSSSFSVMSFFQSFFGAIFLFVGVVAGVGSANTARDREVSRGPAIQIRCTKCGRLNPEWVQFCMGCRNPV